MGDLPQDSEFFKQAHPQAVRIEACSACQLRCTLCPTTRGETAEVIGRGSLKLADFQRLINRNPQIRRVELGNFGEVFLNRDLPRILQHARVKQVATAIDEGANLNDASEEALEALVLYQTEVVRCAIDGITQETYSMYRVGGDLRKVLRNIETINHYKEMYGSDQPRLIFQFVVFGHNEHEMERAILLASMLKMEICLKLNFFPNALSVSHRERVRQLTGFADRVEYVEQEKKHYCRHQCYELWNSPQINWDGKLLGCSRNIWVAFADNVFESDLETCVNHEKMMYAREMVMGKQPLREDMPCRRCSVYKTLVEFDRWITEEEVSDHAIHLNSPHPTKD